ncbi:hypothetical protein PCS_01493 [Desulfocurvibacter africanus PCS]|uniref:Transcriptional regulator n=1 Tax=Desulfocurvibacter africanus PCS TaxID=1262666 RepID=M5Q1M7_DESAF|nr:hypothetical protein [Desulfocurvibacter africanus]EMG37711.1 hypothetical protein PCS_01493 [Desulfocurvibacter africanus PCS]
MTTDLISKLFLLHSVIRREVNAAIKRGGYPWRFEHYIFLSAIPPGKGIPLKYISTAIFGRDQPPLRRALDALEKAKLIRLKREAADRRHLRIHITSEGLDVLAVLHQLIMDSIDQALINTESEMLSGLADLLDRLQVDAEQDSSEVA